MTRTCRQFLPYFFFLFSLLTGCHSSRPSLSHFSQNRMTIDYHISIGEKLTSAQIMQVEAVIAATFEEVDQIYNKWNPQSEISALNQLQAYEKKQLSPQLFELFTKLDKLIFLTKGRLDPTIEPLQKLWISRLEKQEIPTQSELNDLKPCIGWQRLHFEKGVFFKEEGGTQIDLGGIAKGLCVDLLLQRLNQLGFQNVLVDWGGEIKASGLHPERRPWTIYISCLENSDPQLALAHVPLYNQALATSGDYFQNWTVSSKTYYHIFNPITLKPLEIKKGSIASASLLAEDCLTADCLAKVLLLFDSAEEAQEWLAQTQIPNVKAWLFSR